MKKTLKFKNIIKSNTLEFIMEAHNGLSAKIVEETGFSGIWASGLSLSAALGVRDNNEASWTQIMDVLEFMSDATSIPILLDGDTGYGNFNNMRRLVKKLEQRDVAAVCIEDKLFPKTNSFIGGERQPLADVDEFCGRIKAGKDAQRDSDFSIVARVEAFIAGWGVKEALRRAEAYRKAGADAILVHSKRSDCLDIESFMKEWGDRHPIVIVPTKYYSTPTDHFRDLGISLVIWANHNIRSSIKAIQQTSKQIYEDQSLYKVEPEIVPVKEIFRLQGADELIEAEKKYLPSYGKELNTIILAASRGEKFGELTGSVPKTLLKIGNKTILESQVEEFNGVGIKNITVVRGYKKEAINQSNLKTVDNDIFETSKDLYSLYLAKDQIKENTVISYGDIVFRSYILNELLNDQNDITLIVDADFSVEGENIDYVTADTKYTKKLFNQPVKFNNMGSDIGLQEITGEFIGLWKVNSSGSVAVKKALDLLSKQSNFKQMSCSDLFNEVVKTQPIAVRYIKGSWLDVDSIVDLQKAGEQYA
jgi:phosphoenolpyruvate phosphomutase